MSHRQVVAEEYVLRNTQSFYSKDLASWIHNTHGTCMRWRDLKAFRNSNLSFSMEDKYIK
jgi:hypothetical protein